MTGSYRPPPASDQGPAAPSGFFPRACPLPGFDVLSVGLVRRSTVQDRLTVNNCLVVAFIQDVPP
jgi:hypothetical protein